MLAPIPLFDRLVDEDPERSSEPTPLRTFTRVELYQSIRREVERILSTRSSWTIEDVLSPDRTVLSYGLPDLTHGHHSAIPEQRLRMARVIEATIEAFEPRLTNVRAEVRNKHPDSPNLLVVLSAQLAVDEVREPVSFSLPMGGTSHVD